VSKPERSTTDERDEDKPKDTKRVKRGAAAVNVERAVVAAPERR
jgi:hypothetical protein